MPRQVDPIEALDWITLAAMAAFYGWVICLVSTSYTPLGAAALGVAGCYFLLYQLDQRRQRRKLAADTAKREAGEFDKPAPAVSSAPVRTASTTTENDVWKAGSN